MDEEEEKKGLLFKIDFEKAFDTINWDFICSVLEQMNFPSRWILWIKGVLSSAKASVLVNGSPTLEFRYSRGVRQGDPISPLIFVIAMEAFSCFVGNAKSAGRYSGIQTPHNGPHITHLMYADDVLMLGEWKVENVENIFRLMRAFYLVSGLKINVHKSVLFGNGCSNEEIENMAIKMKCKSGNLPFDYLGLKVGANMKLFRNWKSVIDLVENRLSLWKAATLSIGGRVTLLKSVFEWLPVYYFSIFKAPQRVICKLDGLRRKFLWGGNKQKSGINWVRWDQVTQPKSKGGLGLTSLKDFNLSLLAKWQWRYKEENGRLWQKTIEALRGKSRSVGVIPCLSNAAGCWNVIANLDTDFECKGIKLASLIQGKIGNGNLILFWLDKWLSVGRLVDLFPDLFKIELCKKSKVAERIIWDGNNISFSWNWKRQLGSVEEKKQYVDLLGALQQVILKNKEDEWSWGLDESHGFTVKSLRTKLVDFNAGITRDIFLWNNWLPLKVNVFGWRALLDKLPTKQALYRRNIGISSIDCVFCNANNETVDHLFTGCNFTNEIWVEIGRWVKLLPLFMFSVKDVFSLHTFASGSATRRSLLQVVILLTCWVIWKERNNRVFNNTKKSISGLIVEIKASGFFWVKYRAKLDCFNDKKWMEFEFE